MKKLLIFLLLAVPVMFFTFDLKYEKLEAPKEAIVNDEVIDQGMLQSYSKTLLILQELKTKYTDFYNGLTGTATGMEFLQVYYNDQLLKITNKMLFIQYVESKSIDLNRISIKQKNSEMINGFFEESKLSDKDISYYLFSKGYVSKDDYINYMYYENLYNESVKAIYDYAKSLYDISETEIKKEYENNTTEYISQASAEIMSVRIESKDEADRVYKKLIEGYYSFDEIYNTMLKENNADKITIPLNGEDNRILELVRKNAAGYILEPYQSSDNYYIIIKINKKNPSKQLTLEQAKEYIINKLKDEKSKSYFDNIVSEEFKKFSENSKVVFNFVYK